MIEAIKKNTEIPFSEISSSEQADLFKEAVAPIIDDITQNLPISHHDLETAVNEATEKVSIDGKLSVRQMMIELKSICDRLDYLKTEMDKKAQVKSEKKIKKLAEKQAITNRNKGSIALAQMIGSIVVSITAHKLTTIDPVAGETAAANARRLSEQIQQNINLSNQIVQQFGGFATSHIQGNEIRYQSQHQLEQTKRSEASNKAQQSQTQNSERAQMLQGILQAHLGAASNR